MNCFLSSLGMVPQVIQTNRYTEADEPYAKEILQYTDPYVCKAANIAPLQYVYDVLSPYLYWDMNLATGCVKKVLPLFTATGRVACWVLKLQDIYCSS